jgi:hypothetical protein
MCLLVNIGIDPMSPMSARANRILMDYLSVLATPLFTSYIFHTEAYNTCRTLSMYSYLDGHRERFGELRMPRLNNCIPMDVFQLNTTAHLLLYSKPDKEYTIISVNQLVHTTLDTLRVRWSNLTIEGCYIGCADELEELCYNYMPLINDPLLARLAYVVACGHKYHQCKWWCKLVAGALNVPEQDYDPIVHANTAYRKLIGK